MDLHDYRLRLDEIDDALVKLFVERMEVSAQIAEYKRAQNLPVLDSKREREKIQSVMDKSPEELREYSASLYSLIMELSRCSQHRLLGNSTELTEQISAAIAQTPPLFPDCAAVACQGVEGAYAQLACVKLFRHPDISFFSSFDGVFSAIENGRCAYGVIPVENSTAGSVNAVYDLMMKHNFRIVRSLRLKVDHNLLVKPGTRLSDIKEIYSHQQAISQCSSFLRSLPGASMSVSMVQSAT